VPTEREEKSAIPIASNEPFSGWTKTFTDPRLCAAIVDRLTFNGQIIETGTTSYRLARTSDASSQMGQPEAKVAKSWIMNEPLAGLGRVSKSASLLHGQRPCPAAPTGSALKSFRPVLASSVRSRDCFHCWEPMRFACGLPDSSQAESRFR